MVRTPGFHPGNRGSIPLGSNMNFTKDEFNQIKEDIEKEISNMDINNVEVSEEHYIRVNTYMEHNVSKMEMIYEKERELMDKYPNILFDFHIIYK